LLLFKSVCKGKMIIFNYQIICELFYQYTLIFYVLGANYDLKGHKRLVLLRLL